MVNCRTIYDLGKTMSENNIKTACVRMVGPDDMMDDDMRGYKLQPVKCPHCGLRDIDYIVQPYLLRRGVSSPAETSEAQRGNFLVRERVKRILEMAVPDACIFYPTAERKGKKPTAWWLAVPNQKLPTIQWVHLPLPPRCSKCGEPKSNWGDKEEEMIKFNSGGVDVFKSLAWDGGDVEFLVESHNNYRKEQGQPPLPWSHWGIDAPPHPERWTRCGDRDLYFSVRLEQLFKRAKVKGQLVRSSSFKEVKPSSEDEAWIAEKLNLLAGHGLVDAPKPATGKIGNAAQKWLKQFMKKNATKESQTVDFAVIEKKHQLKLPQDYKDFIAIVGEKSFADVNDKEGSATTVLPPEKLDFNDYRRGKVPYLEGDDAEIDGVMFASTDFGDCLVFDVLAKDGDYPVFWYGHEENTMEPFAPNFAGCIKRFVLKN